MIKKISGNIIAPKGFKAGSVHCGLKRDKRNHDIGIIFSEQPCKTAALFTTNQIVAAPIKLSRNVVKNGKAHAIVVNSGNANACTGKKGEKDAESMALLTSKHLNIKPDEVIVASTGIIGHHLPMAKIKSGISKSAECLGNKSTHAISIAKAIMTTDLVHKHIAVNTKIGGKEITIGAIAKGSGMISPDMATMFCFITTDAAISLNTLRSCIKRSTESSFNQITVDGHMSTSDMVAILANGMAKNRNITSSTKSDLALFQKALDYVTQNMAKEIVKDGEGATKFVQIEVHEAKSVSEARKIARSIAESPLVKTAINGEDPNWGRIVSAAGYAGVTLDESKLKLAVNKVTIYKKGLPVTPAPKRLNSVMKKKEITIQLYLGMGNKSTTLWTCDLSKEYVSINADYHT
ncbi:MAG: bifunctional glutamate N-acetyltransferase/amino-acid acetyltransferase ArgJ [Candidatus Scalindua sp.]|jgi:glutamate N-acetyltransferase/amino-acid N-acetyltransferase|nr:bifunctional glutamate N-acetyltransferase/amino-acid acetyltransferase ArgJ [Candidatus Scalindua sp.]MDV5165628.1 bifunctional glutamate N-acetyltransferase/amino-acid acetyltransferase ArgJ [Candidatus Scalindua sp.]